MRNPTTNLPHLGAGPGAEATTLVHAGIGTMVVHGIEIGAEAGMTNPGLCMVGRGRKGAVLLLLLRATKWTIVRTIMGMMMSTLIIVTINMIVRMGRNMRSPSQSVDLGHVRKWEKVAR